MLNRTRKFFSLFFLMSGFLGEANASSGAKTEAQLERVIKSYRTGEFSKKKTWIYLNKFSETKLMSKAMKSRLKAVQAQLLHNDSYPILASLYSSESILLSREPHSRENTNAWRILRHASKKEPIDFILDKMALRYMSLNKDPKFFEDDWNYIVASALVNKGKNSLAKTYFQKLKMKDRYYLQSQYQLAMINIEKNLFDDAEANLKSILNPVSQSVSPLAEDEIEKLRNYTHMALARMYYEQGKFLPSSYHYRKVAKLSPLFYDALYEQSWSLFMAGKPRYALGSLYGSNSPYFANKYNPESKILETIIYFWMCRYDESRNALADFASLHAESVEGLKSFLDRQRLSPETTYQLFENMISGVSEASIGISIDVLKTASQQDSMRLIRNQYASILEELQRLETRGIYKSESGKELLSSTLEDLAINIQKDLGRIFLGELRSMNDEFSRLYGQAQFLYLELLMGQKEHLLGRELHAGNKMPKNISAIRSWGQKTQSWTDMKYEHWWDEVGYQVVDVKPLCNQ